jgi:hypothetical protein
MPGPGSQQPQYVGDMGPMDTAHKTMMWQQNQYMVDSGIHSGSTTHAPPSVSSKHGAMDTAMDDEMDTASRLIYDFDNGFTHGRFQPDPIEGKELKLLMHNEKDHDVLSCFSFIAFVFC